MKMQFNESDIYDIKIDDITEESFVSGCPEGYEFNDVNVDDVKCNDNITIDIFGNCISYGYHSPFDCVFEGKLTIDQDEFTYAYTEAAEHGDKYVEFTGKITLKLDLTSDRTIEEVKSEMDDDEDIDDIDDYIDDYDINARVYFSDLDP